MTEIPYQVLLDDTFRRGRRVRPPSRLLENNISAGEILESDARIRESTPAWTDVMDKAYGPLSDCR
jgi:hypothetical protein